MTSYAVTTDTSDGDLKAHHIDPPASDVDFIYYIDPAGSDSNNGLTALTPFLTLSKALSMIPAFWGRRARVICAAGTYTISGAQTYFIGHPYGSSAEPLLIQGVYAVDAMGVRTVTAASEASTAGTQITDNTLAEVVDAHEGAVLEVLTGVQAGKCALVYTNTADTFTLNAKLGAIAPGDTFRVKRPGTIFNIDNLISFGGGADAGNTAQIPFKPALALQAVRWNGTAAAGKLYYTGLVVYHEGVEYVTSTAYDLLTAINAQIRQSSASVLSDSVYSALRAAACYYISGGDDQASVGILGGAIAGSPVLGSAGINQGLNTLGNITPFMVRGGRISLSGSTGFLVGGNSTLYAQIIGSTARGITVNAGAAVTLRFININNSTSHAIQVETGAFAAISNVTGAGNVGYGLRLANQARVFISAANTVTGTLGDCTIGAAGARTWAQCSAGVTDGQVSIGDGTTGVADDISFLTAEAAADDADSVRIWDNSGSVIRRQTRGSFLTGITDTQQAVKGADGLGVPIVLHKSFAAGVAAAADDVTIFAANFPYAVRILDVQVLVSAGNLAGRTVQFRSAAGGGGSVLSDSFDCELTARKRETDGTATYTVAANGSMYLRRSHDAVAGEYIVLLVKE